MHLTGIMLSLHLVLAILSLAGYVLGNASY
jgi:hypothetical protein